MKILKKTVYKGRNIYSHKKCIKAEADITDYSKIICSDISNFNFNLFKILPELENTKSFSEKIKSGAGISDIWAFCVITMQQKIGIDVSFEKAGMSDENVCYIAAEYKYKNTALEIITLAADLINALIKCRPINFSQRLEYIKNTVLIKELPGFTTQAICRAAKQYKMPVMEIENSGIYQIGYGKQGRIINGALSGKTSCIGADAAGDKILTKTILKTQCIPVPDGKKIFNVIDLLRTAEKIGYPVVLKPQYGNHGKNIKLNLKDEKELLKAYSVIIKDCKDIIIEKYISGKNYRVLVIDKKVTAVSEKKCPCVKGDGKDSVKILIDRLNNDKLRGISHEKPMTKVKFDEELDACLLKQNIDLNYIPEEGEKILLRETANLSAGASAENCTDKICQENKIFCIRAAEALNLDICGIDICASDISVPLDMQGGAVIEANASPGLRMHQAPLEGMAVDAGKAVVDMLYENHPENIPVISVTGTNGKTTTVRLIEYILRLSKITTGMTTTDGTFINGKCIHEGDDAGYKGAQTVLFNKNTEAAVLETARGGIIKRGLAYDLADVAVITNIKGDHIGLDGIKTKDDLRNVKSLAAEAVKKDGCVVINADDEESIKITDRIKSEIIYFSMNSENSFIKENIKNGKKAVFYKDGGIYISDKKKQFKIADEKEIPLLYNGILKFNTENIMAACAALAGLKTDFGLIRKGLETFNPNRDNRGRFNIFKCLKRTIILDYGHNTEGYKAVFEALKNIKEYKKITGVIGVPGDRKDSSIQEIGKLCAENLDEIIIKEDKDKRGRDVGEVAVILRDAVKESCGKKACICLDEYKAFKKAVSISKPEEAVIIFCEEIQPVLECIKFWEESSKADKMS